MIQLQTRRIISLSAWTLTLTAYCTTAQTIRPSREIATLEQSNIASVAQAVESMLRNGQLVSHRIQHDGQMPERTHERLDMVSILNNAESTAFLWNIDGVDSRSPPDRF